MDKLSYKIGFAFGEWISFLVCGFLRLMFKGVVTASKKYHVLIGVYSLLLVTAFSLFLLEYDDMGSLVMIVCMLVFVGAGIRIAVEEYPEKRARKFFTKVFEEIKMKDSRENVPYYQESQQKTDYAMELTFYTYIPLSEWKKRQQQLEMHFNAKIIDILQDDTNNRLIYVTIQTKELPGTLNWNEFYNTYSPLVIGEGVNGVCTLDLEHYPHSFICGETGSGKSNIMKCLIHQSLMKQYEVKLIDFKRGVSFSYFSSAIDIYYEYDTTLKLLKDMVFQTNQRLDLFREAKVDNINAYNRQNGYTNQMKRIIIFIDELAELLKIRDKEIANVLYDSIETLTRLSRATGIHLIIGIQRPDSNIINGQIKNNVTFRVCGHFVDKEPSRIVLGNDTASRLPNIKGRFIVRDNGFQEIQAFYISDIFLNNTYKCYKGKVSGPIASETAPKSDESREEDKLVDDSLKFDFSDI